MAQDPKNKRAKPRDDSRNKVQQALVGAAALGAAAGAAYLIGNKVKGSSKGPVQSDAPRSTRRGKAKDGGSLIGKTVTINKPRQELYAFWRDFPIRRSSRTTSALSKCSTKSAFASSWRRPAERR